MLEYIHISDQYTGMKAQNGDQPSSPTSASNTGSTTQQQDALNTSERAVRRVLIIAFNLIGQNGRSLQVTSESLSSDYLRLVLHLIDRVSTFSLPSKESKLKAIKNRQRIEEQFLKSVNQQRQEQAQQRREEQRRVEKEKIMQSDDTELQRKWEEKEHKREMKRRQPKMKQMKVKAM
jgi:curved DNA-binding protein CbpA